MPLIKSLRESGYEVFVLTQFDGYEKKIKSASVHVCNLFISRKGINPLLDVLTFFHISYWLIRIRPYSILCFTIKPVIYGALAARLSRVRSIVTITGLGTAFLSDNWITKVVSGLYKVALSSVSAVFFQNKDDVRLFTGLKLVRPNLCRLSPGSGIDLDRFAYAELKKAKVFTFLMVARLLWDKGVGEYVEAARRVRNLVPKARFQLLGPLGVQNRSAIEEHVVFDWVKDGIVEYLGEVEDIQDYVRRATCVVLPSYREGTSRVLLEAASIGRPILTTDVPGCREVVKDGVNGFLCRSRDPEDLADKMMKLISLSHDELVQAGNAGREIVEDEFSQNIVGKLYMDALKS
jgi:glycosyltransferase involved in cell wall biosynthesis